MLWKALQTHLFRGTQQLFCLKVLFFENWCPFHSFICYFNLLFLFVILDSVPLLTHIMNVFDIFSRWWLPYISRLYCVYATVMLFLTKHWVHTDRLIDFGNCRFWCTSGHKPSVFHGALKPMIDLISDWKIRSIEIDGQNILVLL